MFAIILISLVFLIFALYWFKNRRVLFMLNKFETLTGFHQLKWLVTILTIFMDNEKRYALAKYLAQFYSGKSFQVWLLHKPYLLINSPAHIDKISQELDRGIFSDIMPQLFGDGLLTAKPDRWKINRRIFNPLFKNKTVYQNFLPVYNEQNIQLVNDLMKDVTNGGNAGMNIISKSLSKSWNVSVFGFEGQDYQDVKKEMSRAAEFLAKQFIFPPLRSPMIFKSYLRICGQHKIFEDIQNFFLKDIRKKIDDYENKSELKPDNSEARESLVDYLLKSHNLSEKEMNNQIMNFLVAGKDTIITTVFFTLLELAMKQDIQEKVYLECCEIFGDQDSSPTSEDLSRLVFLEQCIMESLRLYPPIPLYIRKISKDILLDDDLIVPEGIHVLISPLLLHLNPKFYPNPHQWNPSNFDADKVEKRPRYSFASFGNGPRACVGKHFGLLAMKSLIAAITRNFKLSTPQKEVRLKVGMVLKSVDGFNIRFTPRER